MSLSPRFALLTTVVVVTGCGTPENSARHTGIPESDVMEIRHVVQARTSAQILSYRRMPNGDIDVDVRSPKSDQSIYVVHRVKGKWQIDDNVVVLTGGS